jgi:Cu/Ag efflux pump CusA
LLVSRYRVLQEEGKSLRETIIEGSLDRLNPILMTALTTGLALIPLALAGGEAGNEIQSPMAVVILGGLISSTFLNLAVIPAIFRMK